MALTSTGAGAGNAVGALVEAMNAGTPLLHLTGQVEKAWLDADTGFIHETRDQLTFLKASSKRAYRISNANQAVAILHKAIQERRRRRAARSRWRSQSTFRAPKFRFHC